MIPNAVGLIGQIIGGYHLERLLGTGGTGAVYLGRRPPTKDGLEADSKLDEQVAVKVLLPPPQLSAEELSDFQRRFQREAQTLQKLDHPHVLAVKALGTDEATGLPYMILPYLSGGTLSTRITAGVIPLPETLGYITQLADALDYAHKQGLIHRDIKPANVLLDEKGQVYLADFGLVKIFEGATTALTTLTSTGQVMGTAEYMSPEQARGQSVTVTTDVYSLGMALYHMVTGKLPFQAVSLTEVLLQIIQSAPPAPRGVRPDLPEPAEAVILQALAKEPEQRFASAGALAQAFAMGLNGQWANGVRRPPAAPPTVAPFTPQPTHFAVTAPQPVVLVPPPAMSPMYAPSGMPHMPQTVPPRRRGAGPWVAGIAALVLLALGGTLVGTGTLSNFFGGHGESATATATNQQTSFATATTETTATSAQATATNTPRSAPTKTAVLPPAVGTVREWTLKTSGSQPRGITRGPDGNLWFVEYAGNKIGRITPQGSIQEYPIPTANSDPNSITTGPDGALWFTELNTNQIGRVTTSGSFNEFPVPNSGPAGITTGSDGALWFTEFGSNKIGRMTTGGSYQEFPVSSSYNRPTNITSGPDGALWFTLFVGAIGRITTSGSITYIPVPSSATNFGDITTGPDGNLWVAEYYVGKIARITVSGSVKEFPIPTASSAPTGIISGPDGALWFNEYQGNQIGRITLAGSVTEYPIGSGNIAPYYITRGPDNNLWFTENGTNRIGRIVP